MKLGYRQYIYVGYYFEFSSSNTCISHPKWKITKILRKRNIMVNTRDNINTLVSRVHSCYRMNCVYCFSQFIKEMEKRDFEKPRLHFQIFPNSLKSLKIGIFEVPLPSYFVKWWEQSFSTTCGVREEKPILD